jgi:hypothetical protein
MARRQNKDGNPMARNQNKNGSQDAGEVDRYRLACA